MKTIITFLCVFILVSTAIQADVYVKGIMHFEGGYRYGHNVPDIDVVNEWWFDENKVTFMSTGWQLEFANTDWRFTLDKERERIIVVNLSEKSFVEVPLQMSLLSHVDQSTAEWLNEFQIDGKVEETGEKVTIHQKECDVYEVSEWMIRKDDRFYDRKRAVMATSDVSFDWQIVNELYQWISSFFNPQQYYLSELKKLKGFVLEAKEDLFEGGSHVIWSFKVMEISQKKAPENIYDIRKDFNKKEKFMPGDLFYMRGIVYPYPLY